MRFRHLGFRGFGSRRFGLRPFGGLWVLRVGLLGLGLLCSCRASGLWLSALDVELEGLSGRQSLLGLSEGFLRPDSKMSHYGFLAKTREVCCSIFGLLAQKCGTYCRGLNN